MITLQKKHQEQLRKDLKTIESFNVRDFSHLLGIILKTTNESYYDNDQYIIFKYNKNNITVSSSAFSPEVLSFIKTLKNLEELNLDTEIQITFELLEKINQVIKSLENNKSDFKELMLIVQNYRKEHSDEENKSWE